MVVVVIDTLDCIALCGLRPDQYDQIRLCVMAAQECGLPAIEELAIELHIQVRCCCDEPVPYLVMGWNEVTFLMTIMINAATEKVTRQNARLLNEIIEGLTCAVIMGVTY